MASLMVEDCRPGDAITTDGRPESAVTGFPRPGALALLVALIAFALLLGTAGDIGVTWDEPIYAVSAESAVWWLRTLLRDPAAAFAPESIGRGWGLAHEQPPLVRLVIGLGWALTREWLPLPLAHRVGNTVLAAALAGLVAHWGARTFGGRAGVFAAAALLAMPRLFFHAHLAALDLPAALLWTATAAAFWWAWPRRGIRAWLIPALVYGLALYTKISTAIMPLALLTWGAVLVRGQGAQSWRQLLGRLALLPLLGAPLSLLLWPWMLGDTATKLRWYLSYFTISHPQIGQWFAGQYYMTVPWYVPLLIILLVTPLTILAMAGAGLCVGTQADGRRTRLLWGLNIGVAVGWYLLPGRQLWDQERLLMPALPFIALLAGAGFAALADWCKRRAWPRWALALMALLLLAPGVVGIARWHPYELAYYSAVIGGPRGAAALGLESTYWSATYAHFLPVLNETAPTGATVWVMPNSYDVMFYYQAAGRLRPDLVLLRPPGWGSFYDGQGVPWAAGEIEDADIVLLEMRQTGFTDAVRAFRAAHVPAQRLTRHGVTLAELYWKDGD